VLVPSPDLILAGLPIDAEGNLIIPLIWPAGIPEGVTLYYQVWTIDAGAPAGLAATNGLAGTTPPGS
jgi:hypothetical protein